MKRILVAQADSNVATGGPKFPLAVGIVRWRGAEPYAAVVVKAAFSFAGTGEPTLVARVLAEREPFRLDTPSELEGASERELGYPSDFVLHKPDCDVILTGHAYSAEPTRCIEAAVRFAGIERRWRVVSAEPETEIALCRANLRGPGGELEALPVGPEHAVTRESAAAAVAIDEFDFASFQSAPIGQRAPYPTLDTPLELIGLSPAAPERRIALAGLVPHVVLEAGSYGDERLEMLCDTVWIDTDFERLVVCWRATRRLLYPDGREIQRLVVSFDRAASPRPRMDVLRELARGHITYAVEEDDVRAGVVVEPSADELDMARYETLEHAAEPTLSLAQYAQVSAELAEQDTTREQALERHVLDERSWAIEERGWLERMGQSAMAGDGRLAVEFGQLFIAAQDGLKTAQEPRALEQYAEIKVALENAEDPTELLQSRTMRLAEWMRLERHWLRQAKRDPAVAARLERLLGEQRARAQEPAPAENVPEPEES